jgi:hypothetical protein
MQSLKTLAEFDAVKSGTKTIAISSGERSHRAEKKSAWTKIRVQLEIFHSTDKTTPTRRWDALGQISVLCLAYTGGKNTTERSGNRARFAQTLGDQATLRLRQEQAKANSYGWKVNEAPITDSATRRSPGKAVGGQNQGHGEVRFERALPTGSVYHGKKLFDDARGSGVDITGDDFKDAYALRAYVKKIEREDTEKKFRRENKIPYFTNDERTAHQLTLETLHINWQGGPLSTVGLKAPEAGVSDHQSMYVISQEGAVYVRKDMKKFNHSCFTAGDSVICAGMLTAINGRLTHISNGSGHYGPGMAELLDACDVFVGSPYANLHDAYVVYMDFANVYGRGGTKQYRIPFFSFLQANGMVNNPQDFEVTLKQFEYAYSYVNAAAARARRATIHPQIA